MSFVNLVEIDTPFGHKSVELHLGDITNLEMPVDLICVSSYKNSYQPIEGTLIGALLKNCGVNVEKLSYIPLVDLSEKLGVWVSHEIPDQKFKYIACVDILDYSGEGDITGAIRNLFGLLLFCDISDISIKSIAMPLLGAGQQCISSKHILPDIMKMTEKVLQRSMTLEKVLFVDMSEERVSELDSAINQYLCRTPSEMRKIPTDDVTEAVLKELVSSLQVLLGIIGRNSIISEPIYLLTNKLRKHNIRFFELAILGRKLGEALVCDILGKKRSQNRNLHNTIESLKEIDIASWIISYLHLLRVFGNEAAHENNRESRIPQYIEEKDLLSLLFSLNRVVDFWINYRRIITK